MGEGESCYTPPLLIPRASHLGQITITLLLSGCGRGCGSTPDGPDPTDSGPDGVYDTSPPIEARQGVATRLAVLVLDGARLEETLGGDDDWGDGWSDAWDGYTDGILPKVRSEVMPTGALIRHGYNTGVTTTTPAHGDLFTGHREPFLPLAHFDGLGQYLVHYPTLPEALRSAHQGQEGTAWIVANTAHIETVRYGLYPGLGPDLAASHEQLYENDLEADGFDQDDGRVIASARERLERGATMVLANLHQIDRAGHNQPYIYADTVASTDLELTAFHRWLAHESGFNDETLMVMIADHGRHRTVEDDAYPYTNHGCHCSGCREIPMFLWGAGIQRNVEVQLPVVLEDLTSTTAWLLGASMPYSTGLVLTDVLVGEPAVAQRRGDVRVAASGPLVAVQRWQDDRLHRSGLSVAGQDLGTPGAFQIEEPRVLSTQTSDYACWRELTLTEGAEHLPWLLECSRRALGGEWLDTDFPDEVQWPHVAPSLTSPQSGGLVLAYDNSIGEKTEGQVTADDFVIELARWSEDQGWTRSEATFPDLFYTSEPEIVSIDDELWVAFEAGLDSASARYTRQAYIYRVTWPQDGDPIWDFAYLAGTQDSTGHSYVRQAHPALATLDGALRVAWHAYDDQGVHLLITHANNPFRSTSWHTPRAVDDTAMVFGHIAPIWDSAGSLYWARQGDLLTAEVCRLEDPTALPDCQDLGVPFIDSLAATDAGAVVSASSGDGAWELIELSWLD